ncbi:hypothetical protein WJX84_005200 [Apatococcus fuscideae]|uniref:Prolyl endopeptidase n=1 Tax=Apatococcus fuscideae TaxID=2026836 RepID=A0AAW1SMT2_9CHLO
MAPARAIAAASGALVAGFLVARHAKRHQGLKRVLAGNYQLLSKQERSIAESLLANGRGYIISNWPRPGIRDAAKHRLLSRAAELTSEGSSTLSEKEQIRLESARQEVIRPPKTLKRPHKLVSPDGDDVRQDPYYWLRDDTREDPEVIRHLEEETKYARAVLADTEDVQDKLYKEMRGRIQEEDQTTPLRYKGHFYYSRTLEGKQYRVHCRRKLPAKAGPASENDNLDGAGPEEVLLDENAEAEQHKFYMTGAVEESPDEKLLAYAEDTKGGEKFTLHVIDITSRNQLMAEPIKDTAGNVAWANDSKTLFYVTKDQLDRPCKVWRHKLGSPPGEDTLMYEETDESFYISITRSRSDQLLLIQAGSAVTSDARYLSADKPDGEFKEILPRQTDVDYDVSHRQDHIFITIRDEERPNSELLVAPLSDPTQTKVLLPHREDVKLETIAVSEKYLTVFERIKGLQVATIFKLPTGKAPEKLENGQQLNFDEPAYELGPGGQGEFKSDILRLAYTSLTTPTSILDHNMATGKRVTKKVQPVLGGFDKSKYRTERLWAHSEGVDVPISLVYRQDLAKLDGSDPLLLNGYGSYEVCNDPYFSSNRLSLVDRGFVFAIAHARGGGEMGRQWYETGKYLHKKNTFVDFVACAEHLVAKKYTSPSKLCMEGRSAGGLTMGAVVNMRPELFNSVIMGVPFVDVLTTMLDDTIPLTIIEKEEWGDPSKRDFYDYMKTYSPVDNIKKAAYPNILVTGGLHDPRVGYWEPAKFVSKLREHKTDKNILVFKCEMGAGHFSQSGRFDRLKETALEYAFLLKTQSLLSRESA